MVKRILGGVAVVVVVALAGLTLRASGPGWERPEVVPAVEAVDADDVAAKLASLLRVDTRQPPGPPGWDRVSPSVDAGADEDDAADAAEPEPGEPAWVALLRETWLDPLDLRWERFGEGLAVFVDADDPRPPVLWLSHVDVVPVDDRELDRWSYPPFDGTVADGFVWGRGALDNKASIVCQLEALAWLKASGRSPSRKIVMLITPDEEVSGATAQLGASPEGLARLGGPNVVIDEGSFVLPDFLPGSLVGAIAVGEKTFVSYDLVVEGDGGHASMPTGQAPADVLVDALARLRAWRTPAGLTPVFLEGFGRIAPYRGFVERVLLANADLLQPLLLPRVQASPAGNAVTRDTFALTILDAGVADNVVPTRAQATLNARLLPDTEPDAFLAQLTAAVADERVRIEPRGWPTRAGWGPWDTPTFTALEHALVAAVPEVVVIPSLTTGTMDARYFGAAGLEHYRIHPFVLDSRERERFHGIDERIAVEDLVRGVRFYGELAIRL